MCVTVINKEKGEQINENRRIISSIAQIGVCSLLSRSPKKQSTQRAQNSHNTESMLIILFIDEKPDTPAVVRTQTTTMSILFSACAWSIAYQSRGGHSGYMFMGYMNEEIIHTGCLEEGTWTLKLTAWGLFGLGGRSAW